MASLWLSRALVVLLVIWLSIYVVTAYVTDNRQQTKMVKRSFAGMDLMCQLHARNCVGGFRKRLAEVNEGGALSGRTAQRHQQQQLLPQAPVALSPLSPLSRLLAQQTTSHRRSPPSVEAVGLGRMMRNENFDNDDADDSDGFEVARLRRRLVGPIREAIITLLQRRDGPLSSRR